MWLNISDIYGGYLSNPAGQIYSSQRAMSSPDPKSFFIYFGLNSDEESHKKATEFCSVISGLQRNAFQINSILLSDILVNRPLFEKHGFLMPEFLNNVILPKATGILRTLFDKEEYKDIRSIYGYSELVTILTKNLQRARYECTILDLAKAYEGYSLYFPAFIDFRGRIYRSGIFHFHERDLSRSLLLIDCNNSSINLYEVEDQYAPKLEARYFTATAFLQNSYPSEEGCGDELLNTLQNKVDSSNFDNLLDCIAILAKKSKRPLQFFSNVLLFYYYKCNFISLTELCNAVPVTQDASASAYQLMAYFLLDEEMAVKTNLFKTNGLIHDVYDYIKSNFIIYLKKSLLNENAPLCNILDRIITRSIVKKIFMPMIYGKTLNSTSKDLITSLSQDVLATECVKLSTLCFKFWKDHFSGLESFIELLRLVGRICASLERPVLYSTPYFHTSQD